MLQESSTILCSTKNPWTGESVYQRCCVDLSIHSELSQGSYGTVYAALCSGRLYIAKAVNPFTAEKSNKKFLREVNILSFLNHSNIIEFLGVHYHQNIPLLVMEKMWLKLSEWLQVNPSSSFHSLHRKVQILTDVANGLKYLHSQNVIHHNLTASNVLLHRNCKAKISDFGMANRIGKNMTQLPDNTFYMPPEVFAHNPVYTEKMDIFSFGCVVIHTIAHEVPAVNTTSCCSEIDKRYKYLRHLSQVHFSIIIACLQGNLSCRPSAKQMYHLLKANFKLPPTLLLKECVSELSGEQGGESHSIMYLAFCSKQLRGNITCAFFLPRKITSQNLLDHRMCFFHTETNQHKALDTWWVILWIRLNKSRSGIFDKVFIALNELIGFPLHDHGIIHCDWLVDSKTNMLWIKTNDSDIDSLSVLHNMIQETKPLLPCKFIPYSYLYGLLCHITNCTTNLHKTISSIEASTEEETYISSTATSKVAKETTKENDNSQLVIGLNNTYILQTTSKNALEAMEENNNSKLMLCLNTLDMAQNVNEIATEEAVSEETITLSPKVCISLPNLQRCDDFSQFQESDNCEKIFKLAAIKLESPIICLKYVSDELKMWLFIKVGIDIKTACLSVKHHSFTDLILHLDVDNSELPFATLYETIFTPIIEQFNFLGINILNRCIIVPQDLMHLVPYYALLNVKNGELLGDKCELSIIPSISFLQEMNRSKARSNVIIVPDVKGSFLIVGDPTISSFESMPYAVREAKFIANMLGTDPVLNEEATKETVVYQMKSAKIIHLAVHGPDSLAFSKPKGLGGMYMANQGWKLYPNEIEMLNISADLVVLSSCGSERSQKDMVDAFISAGANCVISSLWKVGDKSTYIFMQFFYQLLISGLPSLQAFQRTMQFVRCLQEYNYFVNWGGFCHIGKTIKIQYNFNAKFPITELLGEVSNFPRPNLDDIKSSVLGASDVQICNTT